MTSVKHLGLLCILAVQCRLFVSSTLHEWQIWNKSNVVCHDIYGEIMWNSQYIIQLHINLVLLWCGPLQHSAITFTLSFALAVDILNILHYGNHRYDRPLCPGLQPGPPSQTPGGLGQRYWSVSEVTWPPKLELRRWRSSGPSSVMA